jgi:protein-disulfide isomerase
VRIILAAALLALSIVPVVAGDPSLTGPLNVPAAAPGAPPEGAVPLDDLAVPSPLGDMALGRDDAPVTVVEYASMACVHCAAFSGESFAKLKSGYVDTGKVRYVFREFPLDLKAVAGSILARCVAKGDASKFFAATEEMFRTQERWIRGNTADELRALARRFGLDEKGFEACFNDQNTLAGIQRTQDVAARKLKVESTPTFFVNGVPLKGNDWDGIEKAIGKALTDRS